VFPFWKILNKSLQDEARWEKTLGVLWLDLEEKLGSSMVRSRREPWKVYGWI